MLSTHSLPLQGLPTVFWQLFTFKKVTKTIINSSPLQMLLTLFLANSYKATANTIFNQLCTFTKVANTSQPTLHLYKGFQNYSQLTCHLYKGCQHYSQSTLHLYKGYQHYSHLALHLYKGANTILNQLFTWQRLPTLFSANSLLLQRFPTLFCSQAPLTNVKIG